MQYSTELSISTYVDSYLFYVTVLSSEYVLEWQIWIRYYAILIAKIILDWLVFRQSRARDANGVWVLHTIACFYTVQLLLKILFGYIYISSLEEFLQVYSI